MFLCCVCQTPKQDVSTHGIDFSSRVNLLFTSHRERTGENDCHHTPYYCTQKEKVAIDTDQNEPGRRHRQRQRQQQQQQQH